MVALAPVMAYASLAAGAFSAFGAYQQNQYQAQVAANNAQIAQNNAKAALAAGAVEEQNQRLLTEQRIGKVRANAGAAGVDPNFGSPLDLQSDTAKLGELDALTIRNNAARRAYGYQVEGLNQSAQASLYNSASYGSLLSGATSVGSKYMGFQQSGVL